MLADTDQLDQLRRRVRASFFVSGISTSYIYIVDNDEAVSITNDAEAVVRYLSARYGGDRRIIYRDTEGRWDELVHEDGRFKGFAPIPSAEHGAPV